MSGILGINGNAIAVDPLLMRLKTLYRELVDG